MDLLHQAGYSFETRKSGFPEMTLDYPKDTVLANARGKALTVAANEPDRIVLGADTVVYLRELSEGERIFGQAKDAAQVTGMVESLQGRVHEVHSGVAVVRGDEIVVRHAVTSVRMRKLSDTEIAAYAALGEGVGKAGGYAIQGQAAAFIEWIGGDYTNVVGLPLAMTARMLESFEVRWYS